jgi:hypothetical protein
LKISTGFSRKYIKSGYSAGAEGVTSTGAAAVTATLPKLLDFLASLLFKLAALFL